MGLDPAHRTLTLARHVLQQGFSQALIKIYSLVDCPIYSVVKYRPRQLSLATRLGGLGSFAPGFPVQPKDQAEPDSPEPIQPNVRRQATFSLP